MIEVTKVTKVTIKINDRPPIELSEEDALALRDELDKVLPSQRPVFHPLNTVCSEAYKLYEGNRS